MIELEGLEKKGIRLEQCSEMEDIANLLGYTNYVIPQKSGKFFRKEIDLQTPYKIDTENGILIVKIGNNTKKIKGAFEHLLAIFTLTKQFQNGTLYCRYCKRVLPKQCQIVALLNFLSI